MMFHCGPHFCRAWCVVGYLVFSHPRLFLQLSHVKRFDLPLPAAGWRCINASREACVWHKGMATAV